MKKFRIGAMIAAIVAVALQLGGCAVGSYQARSVDVKNSPLVNPDILVEGKDDQALYRYIKPGVSFKAYDKVLIDPVLVMKDGELDKDDREDYQKLANNAFVYLTKELGKQFRVVTTPEPGTLRIQSAIIDADSTKPVRNTLSTLMPVGIGLSIVKYAATGKQGGVGEITGEMKMTDAITGELLFAVLDRRVGGKEITKLWSSWHSADDALQFWAKRLGFVMCDMRGGGDKCVKP
jgi:hypothetical protein